MGAYPNYNEEEEERRYYRRKRLGVLKNVLAASAGGMLTYGVYLGRWPAARPAGGLGPGPGEEARPAGSPHPHPSGSVCGPEVSQGKRNLGLPSSFTSQSAPWQMQLRRPLSGGVPGGGEGTASALESVWAARWEPWAGLLPSWGRGGGGRSWGRWGPKVLQSDAGERGSRFKSPSLPLAGGRSTSLGLPAALLGIGVRDPFGA